MSIAAACLVILGWSSAAFAGGGLIVVAGATGIWSWCRVFSFVVCIIILIEIDVPCDIIVSCRS
jgi:hypothetical protein